MKSQQGFTLLEVIVAVAILVGVFIIVGSTWSGNLMKVRKARLNENVALLMERKMTEVEVMYRNKPIEEIPEEESGDFGEAYPNYSWSLTSKEFQMPDISGALIAKDGGADDLLLTLIRQTSEFISKSVKEVTVTITLTINKKKLEYPVTTYFVDYNKEMALGGGLGGGGG